MEEIVNLFHGFSVALQPFNIMVMIVGIVLGVIIGVLAGTGRRQRRCDPVAADLQHAADLGHHHAVLHLLGRAVRRRHHLDPVQHTGRAMVGGDDVRRLSDGAARQGRRSPDRRLHLLVRRRAVRRHHDHAGRAAGRELRAAIRSRGEIRGVFPGVLQLRRPEQGAALQDDRGDDDRLCACRGRARFHHRTIAADVRLHGTAQRLRFPDRRHRPVRHRRDPADHGGRPELPRRQRQDQFAGRAADLEGAARVLGDVAALLHHRLLDGHHAGRRNAGILHELRHRQAGLQARQQFRQGRNRRRDRAGDRGACRRHRGIAADAFARRARLPDGGRAARRPPDLGPAARPDAVRRAEGVRLGPDCLDVSRQSRRPDRRAHLRADLRRDPARAVQHHRAAHPGAVRDRRLFGSQQHIRRDADAGLRCGRLPAQEVQLSARPAGAGHRARRQGGGGIPAIAARIARARSACSSPTRW